MFSDSLVVGLLVSSLHVFSEWFRARFHFRIFHVIVFLSSAFDKVDLKRNGPHIYHWLVLSSLGPDLQLQLVVSIITNDRNACLTSSPSMLIDISPNIIWFLLKLGLLPCFRLKLL